MDISKPFIQLPYSFDPGHMADEIARLDDSAWMEHPLRMTGNSALALISRDGGDNDDFDGVMRETPHLARCEYLRQVLASFGEVLGRSRLMRLAAQSEVATHVDFNYHWYTRVRIHIPVITFPEVTFFCADQSLHMQAGESWIFNSWHRHRVTNETAEDRTHLVIDLAGSSRFWSIVREMEQLDQWAEKEQLNQRITHVPYEPGKAVEIRTERYNISPVMAPGELDALVLDLIHEFECNPDNNKQLVDRYKAMLTGFAKDWRETWLLFGSTEEGWTHYQRLIDGVYQQMHPDRRALVTQSNNIGVNPVIVQRILRSALTVEQPI